MNSIQKLASYTRRTIGGDELYWMNLAQDRGLISDNCIEAADVAECDAARAVQVMMGKPLASVIRWLEYHPQQDKSKK